MIEGRIFYGKLVTGDWQLGPRDQEIRSSEGSEGTEDFDVSRMC